MLRYTPFRFLDLPKELRFMVYENLDISTKELQLLPLAGGLQIRRQVTIPSLECQPAITVTLQTLPVQIFSTCRLIYSEALPFLTRKLTRICKTMPRISIDAECLYTCALDSTQKLLFALLDNLNNHSFTSKSTNIFPSPGIMEAPSPYSPDVQQWLMQTTHLLLSQRPPPCPFAGLMGTCSYPTVRLIIDVPKVWRYTTYHSLAVESLSTPSMYTGNVMSQLSQLYSELVEYTKGLGHVKSGAIVFGQEDERVLLKEGLVVTRTVALDFGISKVVE